MVSLLSAIEPLRAANAILGKNIFNWELLHEEDQPVNASNDLTLLEGRRISPQYIPKNLFVCSSQKPEKDAHPDTIKWLKTVARSDACLGAIDTGSYLLAEAQLIQNRSVTLHWQAAPAFMEEYPSAKVSNEIFELEKNLVTCAGGTASLDMMLSLIQKIMGRELALKICDQFITKGIRDKSDKQRIDIASRLNLHHPRMLKVISLMEQNIEEPLSTNQLSEQSHISIRQLQRLFKTHFNKSPTCYYLELRLQRAKQLLKESPLSIAEVSIACGFNSTPHFTTSYKNHFDICPSKERSKDITPFPLAVAQ